MRADLVVVGGMGHRAGSYVYNLVITSIYSDSEDSHPSSLLIQPDNVPSRAEVSPSLSRRLGELLDLAMQHSPQVVIVACNSAVPHLVRFEKDFPAYLSIPQAVASLDTFGEAADDWYFIGRSFSERFAQRIVPRRHPPLPLPEYAQAVVDKAIDDIKRGRTQAARESLLLLDSELLPQPQRVIACSELSLLHSFTNVFGSNVFDTMDVLTEAAVARLLSS